MTAIEIAQTKAIDDFMNSLGRGRLLIPLVEAGVRGFGYSKQTTYNLHSQKKFPVKTKIINGRPFVRVTDLIHFIQGEGDSGE